MELYIIFRGKRLLCFKNSWISEWTISSTGAVLLLQNNHVDNIIVVWLSMLEGKYDLHDMSSFWKK